MSTTWYYMSITWVSNAHHMSITWVSRAYHMGDSPDKSCFFWGTFTFAHIGYFLFSTTSQDHMNITWVPHAHHMHSPDINNGLFLLWHLHLYAQAVSVLNNNGSIQDGVGVKACHVVESGAGVEGVNLQGGAQFDRDAVIGDKSKTDSHEAKSFNTYNVPNGRREQTTRQQFHKIYTQKKSKLC